VLCGRVKPVAGNTIYSSPPAAGGFTIVDPDIPVMSSGATADPPSAPRVSGEYFVAAHYDRAARRVTVHRLGLASDGAKWFVFPELHCVAVRVASHLSGPTGCALDLATLGRFPGPNDDSGFASRARSARGRVGTGGPPP